MQKFKDKYGVIPNVSDKDFFTNSVHVPVWVEITPMQKLILNLNLQDIVVQDVLLIRNLMVA